MALALYAGTIKRQKAVCIGGVLVCGRMCARVLCEVVFGASDGGVMSGWVFSAQAAV